MAKLKVILETVPTELSMEDAEKLYRELETILYPKEPRPYQKYFDDLF